jgi:hypothetical protein
MGMVFPSVRVRVGMPDVCLGEISLEASSWEGLKEAVPEFIVEVERNDNGN